NLACCTLYLTVGSIGPLLWAARLTQGLAEGIIFTSYMVYVAEVVPEEDRTRGLALYGVSGLASLVAVGTIGDWAIATGGFTRLFSLSLTLAFLAALAGLALPGRVPAATTEGARKRLVSAFRGRGMAPVWVVAMALAVANASYMPFMRTFV